MSPVGAAVDRLCVVNPAGMNPECLLRSKPLFTHLDEEESLGLELVYGVNAC